MSPCLNWNGCPAVLYVGALFVVMESSERCDPSDHLLKARGEEVCAVYLARGPLAVLPPGLTLPRLDPCPLPLTLTAAPLFHFPPNNSVTNWACQKTIYHCPASHPPLPSVPSSSLSLYLCPLPSLLQDIPFFPSLYFPQLNGSTFFCTLALYLSALAPP